MFSFVSSTLSTFWIRASRSGLGFLSELEVPEDPEHHDHSSRSGPARPLDLGPIRNCRMILLTVSNGFDPEANVGGPANLGRPLSLQRERGVNLVVVDA